MAEKNGLELNLVNSSHDPENSIEDNNGNVSPQTSKKLAQQAPREVSPKRSVIESRLKRRPFDLVIFGASSSVGSFVVEEMALVAEKFYSNRQQVAELRNNSLPVLTARDPNQFAQNRRRSVPQPMDEIRWAIAGRSAMRLSDTLNRAEICTGVRGLSGQVPVLLADLNHQRSLMDMCQKTSLIMNCAGPYSSQAELLIRCCIQSKTNYVDLCHETSFIELMRQLYSQEAAKAGVYIINGCGFQSMSVEMGLNFTKQMVDGQIEEVKVMLSLSDTKTPNRRSYKSGAMTLRQGIVSRGMWSSFLAEKSRDLVEVEKPRSLVGQHTRAHETIGEEDESEELMEESGERMSPAARSQSRLIRRDTELMVRDMVEYKNRNSLDWLDLLRGFDSGLGKSYCFPINSMISDEAQLTRGEMAHYRHRRPDLSSSQGWRPVRCTSFVSLKSLGQAIALFLWLLLFSILVKLSPLRYLMRAFPSIASLGNVSTKRLDRDSVSHIKFSQTFVAYGTPGDESGDPLETCTSNRKPKQQLLVSRIVGPEPNHVATATFAIQAALTMITERDHLPREGGIMTPGAALAETNIIHQLRKRNIRFEVLKKA